MLEETFKRLKGDVILTVSPMMNITTFKRNSEGICCSKCNMLFLQLVFENKLSLNFKIDPEIKKKQFGGFPKYLILTTNEFLC